MYIEEALYDYTVSDSEIEITGNGNLYKMSTVEFKNKALELFKKIKSGTGTFSIPSIEKFMKEIFVNIQQHQT